MLPAVCIVVVASYNEHNVLHAAQNAMMKAQAECMHALEVAHYRQVAQQTGKVLKEQQEQQQQHVVELQQVA